MNLFNSRPRLAAIAGMTALLIAGHWLYRHLVVNGLEAEARIMMSCLHTLQAARHMESGWYAFFDEWYGAPVAGKNNCNQPAGARELGFVIRWCRGDGKGDVSRFAYRVVPPSDGSAGFVIEAWSGSDDERESFVCFGKGTSRFTMSNEREVTHPEGC